MMIKQMTRGSIIFEHKGKIGTIHGEALVKKAAGFDFVIYADTLKNFDPPFEKEVLSVSEKSQIIGEIKAELVSRGASIDVEGEIQDSVFDSPMSSSSKAGEFLKIKAGEPVPQRGNWEALDQNATRRYAEQGDRLPDLNSAYGTTVWQRISD